MIEKLDHTADIHAVIDKINEIIDFVNDTFIMKVKDGQTVIMDNCISDNLSTDLCIINDGAISNILNDVSIAGNAKCPHCGESYYTEMYSESTAVYYPPIYKDGVNINPDMNKVTTHCRCLNCCKEFDI